MEQIRDWNLHIILYGQSNFNSNKLDQLSITFFCVLDVIEIYFATPVYKPYEWKKFGRKQHWNI